MPDVDHVEPQIFIDIRCYSFISPYCSTFDLRGFAKTALQVAKKSKLQLHDYFYPSGKIRHMNSKRDSFQSIHT